MWDFAPVVVACAVRYRIYLSCYCSACEAQWVICLMPCFIMCSISSAIMCSLFCSIMCVRWCSILCTCLILIDWSIGYFALFCYIQYTSRNNWFEDVNKRNNKCLSLSKFLTYYLISINYRKIITFSWIKYITRRMWLWSSSFSIVAIQNLSSVIFSAIPVNWCKMKTSGENYFP